jgi:hypothetical protein
VQRPQLEGELTMSRNIAIISRNEAVLKAIRTVLDRFNVVVLDLPTVDSIFESKLKFDLFVIDSVTMEGAAALRNDDRFSGTPAVLLIPPDTKTFHPLVDHFDFVVGDKFVREPFVWRDILPLLYRRVTGEQRRWLGTEFVWKLMEARVAAVAHGELLRLLSETEVPTIPFHEADMPAQISAQLDKSLLGLITEDDFSSTLAERLFSELPSLLWVELTEGLVGGGLCEIESLGSFNKYYDSKGANVAFEADKTLSQLTVPAIEFSRPVIDELSEEALQTCASNTVFGLYEIATVKRWEMISSISILDNALRNICFHVRARKEEAPISWVDRIAGTQQGLTGWFGVLSKAAAYAVYYVFVMSLGRAIRESEKVEIPAIGTFSTDGARILFEASRDLAGLIDANPSALVAGPR